MPKRPVQTQFSFTKTFRREHGGDIGKGKRKGRRPFDPRSFLHVVLRSSRAKGAWSLLHHHNRSRVESTIYLTADKSAVDVRNLVNVGNHAHFLLRAPSREALAKFLRLVAGQLAMKITGSRKGQPIGKFWDELVYSRVVSWGRELKVVQHYLAKNFFESMGFKRSGTGFEEIILTDLAQMGAQPDSFIIPTAEFSTPAMGIAGY